MRQPDEKTWNQVLAMFDTLVELEPEARQKTLADIENEQVKLWLKRLLAADTRDHLILDQSLETLAGGLFEQPLAEHADFAADDLIGKTFGYYRVVSELGRGGMSIVMLAERADGRFEKQVALKLIKPGPFSAITSERLAEETRILARLQHPNIAHLLDAGVTEDGIAWTAMEYCEGQSLTAYCDTSKLTINARIELLKTICSAVHHAHKNLIIHRDLKPSNIQIQTDGTVKLLDFGIASMLDEPDTGDGFTQLFTPEYAAPEQFDGNDITTASDIYALGAITHQLLSGALPFAPTHSRNSQGLEQLKAAKQTSLSTPSAVLTELARSDTSKAAQIASLRGQQQPRKLIRQLRGDLDAIVCQSLAVKPADRYTSAQALADELQKYQDHFPVSARTSTAGYRFKKLFARHTWGAVGTAAIALTLLGGLAAALWQADIARENAARAESVKAFLIDIFEAADPWENQQEPLTANELVAEGTKKIFQSLKNQPRQKTELLYVLGGIQRNLGNYSESNELYQSAIQLLEYDITDVNSNVAAWSGLSRAQSSLGDYDSAARSSLNAVELAPIEDAVTQQSVDARILYGSHLILTDDLAAASIYIEETLKYRSKIEQLTDGSTLIGDLLVVQCRALTYNGDYKLALTACNEAEPLLLAGYGSSHDTYAGVLMQLGSIHNKLGQFPESLEYDAKALEIYSDIYTDGHPSVMRARAEVAGNYSQMGRYAEALKFYEEYLEQEIRLYGEEVMPVAVTIGNVAFAQFGAGNFDKAIELCERAIDLHLANGRENDFRTGLHRGLLADSLTAAGQLERAATEYQHAHQILSDTLGVEHPLTVRTLLWTSYSYYLASRFSEGGALINDIHPKIVSEYGSDSRYSGYADMVLGLYKLQAGEIKDGHALLQSAKSILSEPEHRFRYERQLKLIDERLANHQPT